MPGSLLIKMMLIVCLSVITASGQKSKSYKLEHSDAALRFSPVLHNYTTDDGLPSSEVFAIEQDSKGYMWFGTNNGVCRFNGYVFERFPDTLLSNFTSVMSAAMMEDSCGRMWWADFQGKVFYFENGRIHPWIHNDSLARLRPGFDRIDYLVVAGCGGDLWMNLQLLGIAHFRACGHWEMLPVPPKTMLHYWEVLDRHIVCPIVGNKSDSSVIYIQPFESILSKNNLPYLQSSYSYSLFQLRDGYVLGAATYRQTILLFDQGKFQWSRRCHQDVTNVFAEEDGSFLLGHRSGGGVLRFNSLADLKAGKIDAQFLEGFSINDIYKDRDGGYWFSTQERGVFYGADLENEVVTDIPGLQDAVVTSVISEPRTSRLYYGTRNGWVFQIDLSKQSYRDISPDVVAYLKSLVFDQKNQVLVCLGSRVALYQNNSWHDQFYLTYDRLKNYNSFFDLDYSETENLWWSSSPSAISKIDLKNRVELLSSKYPLKKNQRFFSVCATTSGVVWTSTGTGVWEFRDSQLLRPSPMHPVLEIPVYDMHELQDGTILLSSKGQGLVFWKPGSEEPPLVIDQKSGLISNKCSRIDVEADQEVIWVCSEQGASRISADRKTIDNFNVTTGLPTNQVNQVAVTGDHIWFATSRGLVRQRRRPEPVPMPAPLLQKVLVNGMPYLLRQQMRLPYDSSNIRVDWTALHFKSLARINYRYRLNPDGENEAWIRTSDPNVNFTKLPTGVYRLEIQAENDDGFWSSSGILDLEIMPPWWATWWARSFLASVLIAAGVGIYLFRVGQLKRQNQIQRELYELERKALQAQMNPHFIFNCLNSILAFVRDGDQVNASNYLTKFAKLVRHNLLISREQEISLEEEVQILENYLDLEKLRFKDKFRYAIQIHPALNQETTFLPPMLVQPFVENCIKHAFEGKPYPGTIEIKFESDRSSLLIHVLDDGVGLHSNGNQQEYLAHKSVGIQLVKSRLKLLNQSSEDSSVEIYDRKQRNQMDSGTGVTIKVKLSTEN